MSRKNIIYFTFKDTKFKVLFVKCNAYQIIRTLILQYNTLYLQYKTLVKNRCLHKYQTKYQISYFSIIEPQEINFYMCSLYYFFSRSKIMSDYFLAAKPMDIEGEAE